MASNLETTISGYLSVTLDSADYGLPEGYAENLSSEISLIGFVVSVDTAALSLVEQQVFLNETYIPNTGTLSLNALPVKISESIPVATSTLNLFSYDVTINQDVIVDTASLALTPKVVNLKENISINANSITLAAYEVDLNTTINVDLASINITSQSVLVIGAPEIIEVDASSFTINSHDPTLSAAPVPIVPPTNNLEAIIGNYLNVVLSESDYQLPENYQENLSTPISGYWPVLGAHRNGDARTCGAVTVVTGQTQVYVNNKLWSVDNDPNSHGAGNLNAQQANEVYINGLLVCLNNEDADPDNLCPPLGGNHCDPDAALASSDVFVGKIT